MSRGRGGWGRGKPYARTGESESSTFSFQRGPPQRPRGAFSPGSVDVRLPNGTIVPAKAPETSARTPAPENAVPVAYVGTDFERWSRVTDQAPQRWSTTAEIEIYQALLKCKKDSAGTRNKVAICVTSDPIRPAFETLKVFLERFPELAMFDIVFQQVHTLDIQIRTVSPDPDKVHVLAALEVKTVSDYRQAQGSRVWNEELQCFINTGRLAAQRERADLLNCPVMWVIKNVESPWDVPADLLQSLFKLRFLNKNQDWLPAPNDAYVVLIALHMTALAMHVDTLNHAPARLVDLPNRALIALSPTQWVGTVFPGLTPESAAGLQEAYPTPRDLYGAYFAAPPSAWALLLSNIPACSAKRAAELEAQGKRVPLIGAARSRSIAHFNGFVAPEEDAESSGDTGDSESE